MSPLMFLEAIGGLGLLILGMRTSSQGLQKLAGEEVRRLMDRIAGNRFTAAILGGALSSILQSGGAAAIIIVGLMNAGLVSLYQSLGMLLGTSLGTAFVVQFISLRLTFIAAPGIFAGAVLKFFSRRRRRVYLGEVILGVSLIFYGLQMMEENFSPLRETALLTAYQHLFPSSLPAAALLGASLAFFIQSGSAAIGIVTALAAAGLITPEPAVAMVLGEGLGSVCLGSLGVVNGTVAAKRSILAYSIMSVSLLTAVLFFFPHFLGLVHFLAHTDGAASRSPADISILLVSAHTTFSLMGVAVFMPLLGVFSRGATKILRERECGVDMEPRTRYIDFRVVDTPVIAFAQARNEVRRMVELSRSMFADVVLLFEGFDARRAFSIRQKENVLDALQKEIAEFLVILAPKPLSAEIAIGIPAMLQAVNSLEFIGDQTETVLDCLERKKEAGVIFSEAAMGEIREMSGRVTEMLGLVEKYVRGGMGPDEEGITLNYKEAKKEVAELKKRHVDRLSSGSCSVIAGMLFIDIVSSFERITEMCTEIMSYQQGAGQ